jgi:hypothetical protein
LALKWHLITDTAYGTIFENKRPDCRKAILTQQYRAAKKRWDDRPLAGYPLIVLVFVYISPIGIGAMPCIARTQRSEATAPRAVGAMPNTNRLGISPVAM